MGESFQQSMEQDVKKKQLSKHALASLILAFFGIFIFFLMPVAIVLGHVGRSKCKEDPFLGGKGLATGALFIGYGYFSLSIALVCVFLFGPDRMGGDTLPEASRIEIASISLEDHALEACIKKYAEGKDGYFDSYVYMDEIEFIHCECRDGKIENLDGVEDLINLGMLEIGCHGIIDLTPLTTLKHLDHILHPFGDIPSH